MLDNLLNDISKKEISKNKLKEIHYQDIILNDKNHYPQNEIELLKYSILEVGQLKPVLVKEIENDKYMIIDGERRYRAIRTLIEHKLVKIETVLCKVEIVRDELHELDILEHANAYRQYTKEQKIELVERLSNQYDERKKKGQKMWCRKREWIATRTGFSERSVQDYLTEKEKVGKIAHLENKEKSTNEKVSKIVNQLDKINENVSAIIEQLDDAQIKQIKSAFDAIHEILMLGK